VVLGKADHWGARVICQYSVSDVGRGEPVDLEGPSSFTVADSVRHCEHTGRISVRLKVVVKISSG
jgi:hypothetical protein